MGKGAFHRRMEAMETDPGDDLGYRIVMSIAEERDIEPIEITDQLGDFIDVEQIGRIIDRSDCGNYDFTITFRFFECHVRVFGDGTVETNEIG